MINPGLEFISHAITRGDFMRSSSSYHIAGNFDGGNFDVFDAFQTDCQN